MNRAEQLFNQSKISQSHASFESYLIESLEVSIKLYNYCTLSLIAYYA